MRKMLGATLVAMVLGTCGPLLVSTAHAGGFVASDEAKVQSMVNATRQSKGLGALVRNDQLVQMAREQTVRQAEKGSIFHNADLSGEITRRGLDWQKVGENVGMGPNVDLIEDAFLASPHHYENIVDPKFNAVGIGVVDGADGRRYVTQVFAAIASVAPKAAAPAAPTIETATVKAAQPVTVQPRATATPSSPPAASAQPRPTDVPTPAVDPNVVVGGVVEPVDLIQPRFDQAKRGDGDLQAVGPGALARIVDLVTFWS